jgi:chemotaxis protein methyltransferase CheR
MNGYENFIKLINDLIGLDLSLYKERQMKRRIESLAKRHGADDFVTFYNKIKSDKAVFDEFINYLTINVSEFYRNPGQWDVLVKEIVPELLKTRKNLKIWSAACSTGEEPYTIAMAMSNFFPLKEIKILAVDIDKEAINKAKNGIYSEKSIIGVPDQFKNKYFEKIANSFKISQEIKNTIEFKHFNLLKDTYPSNYDLIVCRNVMIYFTEEAKDEMYHKFSNALTPGGILFVGSTEQIISPDKYKLAPSKTFFYKKI